jgi:hypothetical protein
MSAANPTGGELVIESDGSNTFQILAKDHYLTERLAGALRSKNPSLARVELDKTIEPGVPIHLPYFLMGRATKPGERYVVDQSVRLNAAQIVVLDQSTGRYVAAPPDSIEEEMVVRQWVNLDTKDEGLDACGSEINLLIGPIGIHTNRTTPWPGDGVVNISVTFVPPHKEEVRCERTEPAWGVFPSSDFAIHPAPQIDASGKAIKILDASGKAKKSLPVSAREKHFSIAKHVKAGDPPLRLKIALGVGGGDGCVVRTGFVQGVSEATKDSVVRFVNWRKIGYDLCAPHTTTEALELQKGVGWDFKEGIRATIRKYLDPVYVDFCCARGGLMTIPVRGEVSGESIGKKKPRGYIASIDSVKNFHKSTDVPMMLNGQKVLESDKRILKVYLVDEVYSSLTPKSNNVTTSSLQKSSDSAIKDQERLVSISIFPNFPYSSIDLPGTIWECQITAGNKQKVKPEFFDGGEITQAALSADVNLGRLEVVAKDNSSVYLSQDFWFVDKKAVMGNHDIRLLSGFIDRSVFHDFQWQGKIRYRILVNGKKTFGKEVIKERVTIVQALVSARLEASESMYVHPGLDAEGKPRSGKIEKSWIRQSGPKKMDIDLSQGLTRTSTEHPGLIVGPLNADTCPILFKFQTYCGVPLGGVAFEGNVVLQSPALEENSKVSQPTRLEQFVARLVHELGHALGMAPFFTKDSGYSVSLAIPGITSPKNIDEDFKKGVKGNYYKDNKGSENLKKGFRAPHEGSHCASGISENYKSYLTFPTEPPTALDALSANCVMFGNIADDAKPPTGFCPQCQAFLRARTCTDIFTDWRTRY